MRGGTGPWLKRLLIVPPVAIGVGVLVWQLQSGAKPEQRPIEEVARAVRVIEVTPVAFRPRAIGHGTAQPKRVFEATAQVSGKVIAEHPDLDPGRLLEAGTVILSIDPADYELKLARAQANLDRALAQLAELEVTEANARASLEIERRSVALAEGDLARKRTLLERGNTSETVVDQAETARLGASQRVQELDNRLRLIPVDRQVLEAAVELERTQLEQARLDVERTHIRLPFDARIAEVAVEPTQFVNVGEVLAVADSIDVAEVSAQFALGQLLPLVQADIDMAGLSTAALKELPRSLGLEATVRLEGERFSASWEARFDRIGEGVDPETRTVAVVVAVDQPYRKIIPGQRPPLAKDMFVAVELRGNPWPDALVVPRVAIHERAGEGPMLYLADDQGRLQARPVTLGPMQGDLALVTEGLAAGERVVVSDLIPAIEGMKLEVTIDDRLAERLLAQATGAGERPAAQPGPGQ